jgi:hypothetical protein|tara:strand:- start:9638 stop:11497 length:1860 start_codon:yes stop_codon:yes gene_type:complete
MPLQKFLFKPGINKEGTAYSNEGGWFDSNLIRFRKGLPEKIGGWAKSVANSFLGTGRALHAWVALDGTKYLGLGTNLKYYILEGASFNDITPIRSTDENVTTFAATNGSAVITATDTAHGAVMNDFVTISNAVSLGGNITAAVLNQEHQITSIPSPNTYTFTASATANASDSGNGGSATDAAYQINTGINTYVPSTGFGAGTWSAGTWGSITSISFINQLRLWSHDNFGEDLIINPRGGGVFYWDESNGLTTRAVALSSLSGANLPPTLALQVLVSDIDRHVICFGADPLNASGTARTGSIDPMLIAFSDQENAAQWEPLATNTAGSLRLSAGSSIVGALRSKQEILVWTDIALYSMSFIGQPFTFGLNLVNEGVGLISPNGMVNTPKGIFWMDKKGFYAYNGAVQEIPCTVQNYVFSDLNETQSYQAFSFVNKAFDEVGWFYCSGSSNVIDRYVVYNYEENLWTIGSLSRTAWLDEGVFDNPKAVLSSSDIGYVYNHEVGNDNDGLPMTDVFIESSDFDIDPGGEDFQFINRIIPDIKFTGTAATGSDGQAVNLVLKRRNFPGEDLTTAVTSTCTSNTTKIDTRVRGRQAVLRIESNDDGVGFRVGAMRLDFRPDGRR